MSTETPLNARQRASNLVYSVHNWRGRSPGFMQTMVTRWEAEFEAHARAVLAEAERAHRWIPVGEALPECGTVSIVYGYEISDSEKIRIQDMASYSYHGGWFVGSEGRDFTVTHWKYLDEPPTEAADLLAGMRR